MKITRRNYKRPCNDRMWKWIVPITSFILTVFYILLLKPTYTSAQGVVGCLVTSDCVAPLFSCTPPLEAFCEVQFNACTCITPTPTPSDGSGSATTTHFLFCLWWLIWLYYEYEANNDHPLSSIAIHPPEYIPHFMY